MTGALNLRTTPCVCGQDTCNKVWINGLTRDGRFEPEVAAKIVEAFAAADELAKAREQMEAAFGQGTTETDLVGVYREHEQALNDLDTRAEAAEAQLEQLVKDTPPAAQVERWKKLEEAEKPRTWELREAYRAAKMVDDACWGEFCGCCAALLSLDSQDEECGPMHTAAQLTHAWVERNAALGRSES